MIVVDSSAVAAIIFAEPDSHRLVERLTADRERVMSVASYVEVGTVLAGRRRSEPASAQDELDSFLTEAGIALAPVDETQARTALQARVAFGRGFGAPAALNFGDCFSYALAKVLDAPLLYVGDDFAKTDIETAV